LRAARANRVCCTDEKKRIRTANTVMVNTKQGVGVLYKIARLRADVLFIRTQSVIRADSFSSAQKKTRRF
jgi:hypothetical protein